MKKGVAEILLASMLIGLLTNGLLLWKNSGIVESRVSTVERKQEKQDAINDKLLESIDAVKWHLIDSKGIVVPPKESR